MTPADRIDAVTALLLSPFVLTVVIAIICAVAWVANRERPRPSLLSPATDEARANLRDRADRARAQRNGGRG